MGKIRILAILVIVAFIFTSLKNGIQGAVDGWNEVDENAVQYNPTVNVSVKADNALVTDSLFNSVMKQNVPYQIETLQTKIEESLWYKVFGFVIFPIAIACLYGVYTMGRMVVSVTRKEVFVRKNVKRMRIFVYAMILMGICMELQRYCQYCDIVSQIHLPGYEIKSFSLKYAWTSYLIFALFTEIFAVGVKIKEEQDLTI